MSFNWLVTLWYIHHGILLSNKKAQTIDTGNNGDESPENYTA